MEGGGADARPGDRALAQLLALHGLAMNGGIHHALEILSLEQVEAAASGFTYFEMAEVARLLWRLRSDPGLKSWTDSGEAEADRLYAALIPDDQHIVEHFELKFRQSPEKFAPLETHGVDA
jgi:hypothetical protein